MSVIQVDAKILNYIESGLIKSFYRKEVDEFYSEAVIRRWRDTGDIHRDAAKFIEDLADINAINWGKRYNEEPESYAKFISHRSEATTAIQLMKYLELYLYNTLDYEEDFTPEQKEKTDFLDSYLRTIQSNIIHMTEAYKNANWSEI